MGTGLAEAEARMSRMQARREYGGAANCVVVAAADTASAVSQVRRKFDRPRARPWLCVCVCVDVHVSMFSQNSPVCQVARLTPSSARCRRYFQSEMQVRKLCVLFALSQRVKVQVRVCECVCGCARDCHMRRRLQRSCSGRQDWGTRV